MTFSTFSLCPLWVCPLHLSNPSNAAESHATMPLRFCFLFLSWILFLYQKAGNHPNFEKKRSRSEKAILGATLGIPGHSRSNSRNGSHDLIYVRTLFSEQLSERLSEFVGRQNCNPNSRSVFFKIGVVPARQIIVFGCL